MIPSTLYKQILASMPIPSVEAMILKDNSLLFLRRKNKPAKGEWWFPGGRIRKGETFKQTLLRKVKEETGLNVEIIKFVGAYNRIFPERHDIAIVFLCRCFDNKVVLNEEHSEYKFFKEIPKNIHPYLLKTIQDSRPETFENHHKAFSENGQNRLLRRNMENFRKKQVVTIYAYGCTPQIGR